MRFTKRAFALLGCLGIAALFLIGMVRRLHLSSSPVEGAQSIAQTTIWRSLDRWSNFPTYYWSGSNDLTYVSNGTDNTLHLFRRSSTANAPDKEGVAVHLRNGRYAGEISPDGKWFVEWSQNRLRQSIPTFVAVDGTQRREGAPTWGSGAVWTQTSDAMVTSVWRTTAAIDRYRPDSGELQKVALPELSKFYEAQHIGSVGQLIGMEGSAFILNLGKSMPLPSRNYPTITAARIDLNHPDSKPEQWKIAVPEDINNGSCRMSPSGDRILWVAYGETTPPILRWIRSHIPGMSASSKTGFRWLVSGVHGENMHEIASYPYQPTRIVGADQNPYSRPRWMPDSRHISFIFHDTLYTRPVD